MVFCNNKFRCEIFCLGSVVRSALHWMVLRAVLLSRKKEKEERNIFSFKRCIWGKNFCLSCFATRYFFPTRLHACHGCLNSLATMSHSKFGGTRFK